MQHLSDEQLEEALAGAPQHADHLATCAECAGRLGQMRATRARLARAFAAVTLPGDLRQRLAQGTGSGFLSGACPRRSSASTAGAAASANSAETEPVPRKASRPSVFWRWPALAAAAAMLVAAIIVGVQLASPSPATAAQAELVDLHRHNVARGDNWVAQTDPAKIRDYLRSRGGRAVTVPEPAPGTKLEGCCVAKFRGQPAPSYVVRMADGPLSIVILDDSPQSLGLSRASGSQAPGMWTASHSDCRIVAAECPCGHAYYAVGQVPIEAMIELLARIRASCCPM